MIKLYHLVLNLYNNSVCNIKSLNLSKLILLNNLTITLNLSNNSINNIK